MQKFKETAAADIDAVFFNVDEFAEMHTVDGRSAPVILEEIDLRRKTAHWEGGAKQNFDTGLYTAHTILSIRASDYGPKPKVGKQLLLDGKRTYEIEKCEEEAGVYRITMKRTRQ